MSEHSWPVNYLCKIKRVKPFTKLKKKKPKVNSPNFERRSSSPLDPGLIRCFLFSFFLLFSVFDAEEKQERKQLENSQIGNRKRWQERGWMGCSGKHTLRLSGEPPPLGRCFICCSAALPLSFSAFYFVIPFPGPSFPLLFHLCLALFFVFVFCSRGKCGKTNRVGVLVGVGVVWLAGWDREWHWDFSSTCFTRRQRRRLRLRFDRSLICGDREESDTWREWKCAKCRPTVIPGKKASTHTHKKRTGNPDNTKYLHREIYIVGSW